MEGGGFIVEGDDEASNGSAVQRSDEEYDSGRGGFLQAQYGDEQEDDQAGGFLQDDPQDADDLSEHGESALIPLSEVPGLLLERGLEATIEVLDLLRSTSQRPPALRKSSPRPGAVSGNDDTDRDGGRVVSRSNFEEVVNVLLLSRGENAEQQPARKRARISSVEDLQDEEDSTSSSLRRRRPQRAAAARQSALASATLEVNSESEDDSADAFPSADEESPLSSEGENFDEPAPSTRRTKGKGKLASASTVKARGAASSQPKKSAAHDGPDDEDLHLNPHQRDAVRAAFQLFTDAAAAARPDDTPPSRLGAQELAAIAASLKEPLTNAEIEEMLTEGARLFAPASHQHASREGAKQAQAAARGLARSKAGGKLVGDGTTVGLDEMGGIMFKANLI